MIDNIVYNYYDYLKSVYIYSHIKTYLKDVQRQKIESYTNYVLEVLSFIVIFFFAFKVLVIIFYFIFIQAFTAFIKFLKSMCTAKFKINFCPMFKNAMTYLGKVFKRIFTFNFYIFSNIPTSFIMIFSYFFYLVSIVVFYVINRSQIENIEKSLNYMGWFYAHFESFILIQLLISSFYACRNLKISISIAIFLFFALNALLVVGYVITDIVENAEGKYEYDEPQNVVNVIFNFILLLLNGNCLFNTITYKKDGKTI